MSRKPPPRPSVSRDGGETKWFAVDAIRLGVGTASARDRDGWRSIGFDLDDRHTTPEDSVENRNTCRRRPGALTKFLQDGHEGIDNNFGQHVLSTVLAFQDDPEAFVNDGIHAGRYTLVLKIEGLTGEDDAEVPGALYLGGDFGAGASKPTFTEADRWPINPLSLEGGADLARPKVVFPRGYVRDGWWVSGELGRDSVDLGPMLSGADVSLPVEGAVIAVKLDGSDGIIAGAVDTAKLKAGLAPVARRLGLCEGSAAYEEVVKTLGLAADLVVGAPRSQDPSRECDAISLGYGFTMKPTGAPEGLMKAAVEPAPDGCSGP